MKVVKYDYPKSSFLSMQKDTSLIVDKILANDRLVNLLYYTDNNPLNYEKHPKLTMEEKQTLLGNQIKLIPKVYVDDSVLQYIIITFNNFSPSVNPQFRDNTIQFDIICHFSQWQMADLQIRPYKIAAELDSMFNESRLSGIGTLKFVGATQRAIAGEEYAGVTLLYYAIHAEDDKHYFDAKYINRPENTALKQKLIEELNLEDQEDEELIMSLLGDQRFNRPPGDNDLEDNYLNIQNILNDDLEF